MITDSFDNITSAKINPNLSGDRLKCDACIITFSNIIEEYARSKYGAEEVGIIPTVNGETIVYKINFNGKTFAFYKTILGASTAAGCLEESRETINTDNYVVFGGAGCLNKEIARGKIMIPTLAYRDEGTSYHYAEPADYIEIKNAKLVAKYMKKASIPYVLGKTWTTDAFFRETQGNFEKRKKDGCISVEMECSALQAVCDFRNLNLFYFLSSGDLLDAPKWDSRKVEETTHAGTQHDSRLFDIALELADFLTK